MQETRMRIGFILYDMRSGSTFLSSKINQYAGVVVSTEVHYPTQILEYTDSLDGIENVRKLLDKLYKNVQMQESGIDRNELESNLRPPFNRKSILEQIIRFHFRDHPGKFWLIKHTPTRHIRTLTQWFPQVRFVHLIRDVRGVHRSKKNTISTKGRKMSESVLQSARIWNRKLAMIQASGQQPVLVRYEDLMEQPEQQLTRVLEHLGITGMVKECSEEDYKKQIGIEQSSLHANVGKGVIKDKALSWQKELHRYEIKTIESFCSANLKRYGYVLLEPDFSFGFAIFFVSQRLRDLLHLISSAIESLFNGTFLKKLSYVKGSKWC